MALCSDTAFTNVLYGDIINMLISTGLKVESFGTQNTPSQQRMLMIFIQQFLMEMLCQDAVDRESSLDVTLVALLFYGHCLESNTKRSRMH
jgi:hypothetical protein